MELAEDIRAIFIEQFPIISEALEEVMATYPVKHKETGETKDVKMSIHDWDQWKIDNPDWERYFTLRILQVWS